MSPDSKPEPGGLILAGGRATRLGGRDKGLVSWRGQPLVCHTLQAFAPQVGKVYVNANRNRQQYAAICGCPVLPDRQTGFQGPLAGICAGLEAVDTEYMAVVPCDAPGLPADLVQRLYSAADAEIIVAHDGIRLQPLHLLLRASVLQSLLDFMQQGGRKPDAWYAQHGFSAVDFSDARDAFRNLNCEQDFA